MISEGDYLIYFRNILSIETKKDELLTEVYSGLKSEEMKKKVAQKILQVRLDIAQINKVINIIEQDIK